VRVFVAGATGATGAVFVPLATAAGLDLVLHVRPATAPKHPFGADPRAAIGDLADAAWLRDRLAGCDAVLSLVGTMRKRFATGDTYETSDIGTTRDLVAGARAAAVPRFLLLSSVGAGGAGPYLQAKGECERIVRESGLRWTIFRPSALVSPPDAPDGVHGRRTVPPGALAVGAALARIPVLGAAIDAVRPIPLDVLSRAFLAVLAAPRDGAILEGRALWSLA
jgi:uncharacterized protein YbjT (DUF2867 family)